MRELYSLLLACRHNGGARTMHAFDERLELPMIHHLADEATKHGFAAEFPRQKPNVIVVSRKTK